MPLVPTLSRNNVIVRALFVALLLVLAAGSAFAQITSTDGSTASGIAPGSPAGSYGLSEFDNINLYNGNLNFRLPLIGVLGRGGAKHTMLLASNSKGWRVRKTYDKIIEDYKYSPTQSWWGIMGGYGPGALVGRKTAFELSVSSCLRDAYGNPQNWPNYTLTRLTFTMPDGTEYELRDQNTNGQPLLRTGCNTGASRGTVFVSSDSTNVTFISETTINDYVGLTAQTFYPTGYLMLRDGTRYRIDSGRVTWIRDRNGNKVSFAYDANGRLSTITDSLNRQVTLAYDVSDIAPYGLCDKITYNSFGGVPRVIRVSKTSLSNALRAGYAIQTLRQLFPELNAASTTSTHNPTVISSVWLPDDTRYQFLYNSYGELARVVLPTGGAYEYDMAAGSGVVSYLAGGDYQIYRRVAERRVYPDGGTGSSYASRTVYSATQSGPNDPTPYYTNVTVDSYNAGSTQVLAREKHYFNGSGITSLQVDDSRWDQYSAWTDGQEYKTEAIDPSNGAVLRRIENTFQQRAAVSWWTGAASSAPPNDPRITQTLTTLVDTNQVAKKTFSYSADLYNNQTDVHEYDYGAGAPPAYPTRHSHTDFLSTNVVNGLSYNYQTDTSIHLRSLPSRKKIYTVNTSTGAETLASDVVFTYDQAALTDRPGIVGMDPAFTSSYGPRGNVTRLSSWLDTSGGWINTDLQYDVAGSIVKNTDARGYVTQMDYSSAYQYAFPTRITSPIPGSPYGSTTPLETMMTYDFSTGVLTSTTDANNQTTTIEYNDLLDRPTRIVRPTGGGWVTYEYNRNQYGDYVHTQSLQNSSGLVADSYQFYDGLGRPYRSFQYENVDPTNVYLTSDTQYDAMGRVWRVSNIYRSVSSASPINPSGIWTTTGYDKLGRVTSVTTSDSAAVVTTYSGNQATVTDQAGKSRRSVTDALGRLTKVIEDPNGLAYQTDYTYDALSNLRRVSQGTQNRYFMYDSLSRLIRAKNPEQSVNGGLALTDAVTGNSQWAMAYAYDVNGNLISRTDARGVVTSYLYDGLNRNTEVNYSDGSNIRRTYDGSTNGRGRIWGQWWNPTNGTNTHTAIDGYDQMGRPLYQRQQFYNGSTWGAAYNVNRTYDLAGHVTSQTYPSGRTVSYTYDRMGRTFSFTGNLGDSVSRTYMTALAFDDSGRMTREQFGTDTPLYHKQHWNRRGQLYDMRLSSVNDDSNWNRGAIVNYYSLTNWCFGETCTGTDTNGNLQIQQNFIPTDDAISNYSLMQQNYGYDSLNRVNWMGEYMNGSGATPSGSQGYDYDRWGNRTINPGTWGTGINNRQFTVDGGTNRLGVPSGQSGVMQYDANGNLVNDTYTSYGTRIYDAENRMLTAWDSSGQQSSYTYDFDGRRVRRKVGAQAEIWQIYSMDGELVAEYTANASPSTPLKEYGYRDGGLLVTAQASANVQWIVTDQLGTPRMVADRTGSLSGIKRHDYLPFGEELYAGTGNRTTAQGYVADAVRQKFTSYERDSETGLDFAQARYYASTQGRFTSPDPFNGSMSPGNPQSFNRYSYTLNSPLNFVDPLGLVTSGVDPGFYGSRMSDLPILHTRTGFMTDMAEAAHNIRVQNTYDAVEATNALRRGDDDRYGELMAANATLYLQEPVPQPAPTPAPLDVSMTYYIGTGTLVVFTGPGKPLKIKGTSGKGDCVNQLSCSAVRDKGPLPPGDYFIRSSEIDEPGLVHAIGRNLKADWGSFLVAIHPYPWTDTYGRDGFYLHGGNYRGSKGCIDVGGGILGNSETRQLLRVLRSDRNGIIPLTVIP